MRFFHEPTFVKKFGWNKRSLTEDDFARACKRFKIGVQLMPLTIKGFYYCVKGKHYIAIDSRLRGLRKRITMFHELAHFLLHAPESGYTANFSGIKRNSKEEREADAFAWACVFPLQLLTEKTNVELVEEEGYTLAMIKHRRKIYERFGI